MPDLHTEGLVSPGGETWFWPRGDDAPISKEEAISQIAEWSDESVAEIEECVDAIFMAQVTDDPAAEVTHEVCDEDHPRALPFWRYNP